MSLLSEEAEDMLLAIAERGAKHVLAWPPRVRRELFGAGLLRHTGGSTVITDTATPSGQKLAEYVRARRAAIASTAPPGQEVEDPLSVRGLCRGCVVWGRLEWLQTSGIRKQLRGPCQAAVVFGATICWLPPRGVSTDWEWKDSGIVIEEPMRPKCQAFIDAGPPEGGA